ncbi:MAG: hypothetical protein IPK26_22880 [Planctomycetes bacterium]|nr:hypothetical protein [Planctomycetota bacterium]
MTEGSYVGKESNAAAWRLVATGNAVAGPGTVAAPSINLCLLNAPFYLPAGNHGLAVYHRAVTGGAYIAYTNASSGPFANADLSIHPNPATAPGISRTTLFGTSGFSPRQWNGTFYYSKCSLTGDAGYGFFGSGCAGSMPVSTNVGTSWPRLGGSMISTFDNLPANTAVFLLGFSRTTSPFGSLPLDLTSYGATGCFGRVSPDATSFLFGAGGTASNTLGIPNIPSLLCAQVYTQALVLDPAVNVLGAVVSDAAAAIVGQ